MKQQLDTYERVQLKEDGRKMYYVSKNYCPRCDEISE